MITKSKCTRCNNKIDDYYKTNRYYFKEIIETPKEFKDFYIKEVGQEEYNDIIDTYNEIVEKKELDKTFYFIYDLGNFILDMVCPDCGEKLYIGVDDKCNLLISDYFNAIEPEKEIDMPEDILSWLFKNKEEKETKEENIKEKEDIKIGYVYLLYTEHGIKIGSTIRKDKRHNEINMMMPFKINKVDYFKVKNHRKTEKYIQNKYIKNKIKGEWFTLNKNEISDIEKELKEIEA